MPSLPRTIIADSENSRNLSGTFDTESWRDPKSEALVLMRHNKPLSAPQRANPIVRFPRLSPYTHTETISTVFQPPRLHQPCVTRTNFPTGEQSYQKPESGGQALAGEVLVGALGGFVDGAMRGYQAQQQYLYMKSITDASSSAAQTKPSSTKEETNTAETLVDKNGCETAPNETSHFQLKGTTPQDTQPEVVGASSADSHSSPPEHSSTQQRSGSPTNANHLLPNDNSLPDNWTRPVWVNQDDHVLDAGSTQPMSETKTSFKSTSQPELVPAPAATTKPRLEGDFEVRLSSLGGYVGSGATEHYETGDGKVETKDLGMDWFNGKRQTDWKRLGSVDNVLNGNSEGEKLARLKLECRKWGAGAHGSRYEVRNTATGKSFSYDHHDQKIPGSSVVWTNPNMFQDPDIRQKAFETTLPTSTNFKTSNQNSGLSRGIQEHGNLLDDHFTGKSTTPDWDGAKRERVRIG